MCTEYWTLRVDYDCPLCGSRELGQLQTHWLGGLASFMSLYELGERLPHLRGIEAATLGHDEESSFISTCRTCGGYVEWGAEIIAESVARVWPYHWEARDQSQAPS